MQEDARKISVELFKNGENQEEIVVLVTPITFDELKKSLPPEFNNIEMPNPAECKYKISLHNCI